MSRKTVCFYLGFATVGGDLYGSELALINIAKLCSIEHNVYLIGFESSGIKHGLNYLNIDHYKTFQRTNEIDVLIISRYIHYFVECSVTAKKTYVWLHDTHMIPYCHNYTLPSNGKFLIQNVDKNIDGYVCLTEWHKQHISKMYELNEQKIHLIGNAISDNCSKISKDITKIKNRFIYMSSPNRGLPQLVEYFHIIRQRFPDAELYIYRGQDNFNTPELKQLLEDIKKVDYIHYGGSISNDKIMEELAKTDVWFYPTNWSETYCTSALEAMSAGCLCIASDLAALTNVIEDRGVLLKSPIYSEAYKKECIDTITELLSDDKKKKYYQDKGQTWAQQITWKYRYEEWKNMLSLDDCSNDTVIALPTNNNIKYYWINCEKHKERCEYMNSQFDEYKLSNEKVTAITPDTLNIVKPPSCWQSDLELSCTCSHLKALQQGLTGDNEWFIVLEDDVKIVFDIDYIELIKTANCNGIIQLSSLTLYGNYQTNKLFVPWITSFNGTQSYLINKTHAKKILDLYVKNNKYDFSTVSNAGAEMIVYTSVSNTISSTYPLFYNENTNTQSTIHTNHDSSHIYIEKNSKKIINSTKPPSFIKEKYN